MPNAGTFTYWYLQVPNLVLLAIMVLLLVRLVLSFVLHDDGAVMRLVGTMTQPVVATVGAVTPRIVPAAGVIICAIIWLMAVRTVLFMAALVMGVFVVGIVLFGASRRRRRCARRRLTRRRWRGRR